MVEWRYPLESSSHVEQVKCGQQDLNILYVPQNY